MAVVPCLFIGMHNSGLINPASIFVPKSFLDLLLYNAQPDTADYVLKANQN